MLDIDNSELRYLDRDTIIAKLIVNYEMSSKEARKYYADNFKGERGMGFSKEFDDYAIDNDSEATANFIAEALEDGRINKSSGKSFYVSRAKLIERIKELYA